MAEPQPRLPAKGNAEEKKPADNNEGEACEEGLDPLVIKMVQEQCQCTRKAAVNALRNANGDAVNAIMELA